MGQPTRAEIEEAMQYHHPEKTLASLPGGQEIDNEILASFFGTDAQTYREIKDTFAERTRRCAYELLQDARFAPLVDRLPFEAGTTVVGLGDSITDDYQSWLEILRHLLAERRPESGIYLVNAGISGDTSSGLLGRLLDILEGNPAWIITLIGTNDVPFIRDPLTKSLVSPEETGKNLRAPRPHRNIERHPPRMDNTSTGDRGTHDRGPRRRTGVAQREPCQSGESGPRRG